MQKRLSSYSLFTRRFTGHSLGTALATLCYAKALMCPEDLGPNAVLRDAYLYATPITTDVASRDGNDCALPLFSKLTVHH